MNRINNVTSQKHINLLPEVLVAPAAVWQLNNILTESGVIVIDSAAEPDAFTFISDKQIVLVGTFGDDATITWNDWLCKIGATFIPVRSAGSHFLIGPLAGMATNVCLHDLKIQTELNGFNSHFATTMEFDSASAGNLFPALAAFGQTHTPDDLLYKIFAIAFDGSVIAQSRAARFPYDEVCRAPLPPRQIHYAKQLIPHESKLAQ